MKLDEQETIEMNSKWWTKPVNFAVALALLPLVIMAQRPPSPDDQDPNAVYQVMGTGEFVSTGARRPTEEEWAWGEKHMVKAKHVRLNSLGQSRVNEARRARGLPPLPNTEIVELGREAAATTSGGTEAAATLPSGVDNSALKYFPPIRSQGSLGSCAQFSSVYYTLTHMTAMARNLDAKAGGDTLRFSPKWTYNVLNGGANVGTWHYDAYAIAQKHGLATWAEFPYDSNYRAWCLNGAVWRAALRSRADQTGKVLDVDSSAGLTQLKQFLVDGYVLNFATYISSWVMKGAGNDPSTAADDALAGRSVAVKVQGTAGGHAMTIVGYNDDLWVDINSDGLVTADEKGALRIANSWGTTWGEAGYCWLAYQALRTRNTSATSEGIFWYDEACWVTARPAYEPKLVGEFTVQHLKRSQLAMTLGLSGTGVTTPSFTWSPNRILTRAGGAYAFDGATTAVDGTFCLDFSDLAATASGSKRFYLGMSDNTAGDSALLKSFKLVDLVNGREVASAAVPQYADARQIYATVDYDLGLGTVAPVAAVTANPVSGDVALTVSFDGSGSRDPDGSITSYSWTFADGATASGASASHTYTRAGKYNAMLTVTDNQGAQSSSTVEITVLDPNVVLAPSSLTASVSGQTVTLGWIDNSGNETAFDVERAVKLGKGYTAFTVVGRVGANVRSFIETVAAGTYQYRVRALNQTTGAVSPYSSAVLARVH
jgi:chitodextrinase